MTTERYNELVLKIKSTDNLSELAELETQLKSRKANMLTNRLIQMVNKKYETVWYKQNFK
jgi:hypothetical protein